MDREPEKLDIVWEPPHRKVKMHKGWKWEVLLRPVKASPGSPARIRIHKNEATGRAEVHRIKDRLNVADPLGKWEFNVLKMNDRSGDWGVWATYHGQMTPAERTEKMLLAKKRSEKIKKGRELERLKKQISAASIEDLTLPDMGRR